MHHHLVKIFISHTNSLLSQRLLTQVSTYVEYYVKKNSKKNYSIVYFLSNSSITLRDNPFGVIWPLNHRFTVLSVTPISRASRSWDHPWRSCKCFSFFSNSSITYEIYHKLQRLSMYFGLNLKLCLCSAYMQTGLFRSRAPLHTPCL